MKLKIVGIIIAVIFIGGVIGCIFVLTAPEKNTVRILSDGKVLYTLDLSASDDRTIEITTAEGRNIVEIQDHRIRVKDADCRDHTCVRMGWLTGSAAPIVCLPHHLVIEFTDDTGGADAVTR